MTKEARSVGEFGHVAAAPGVHVREFDGELVLLNLERGDYYGLDEIGVRVWKGLVSGESPSQIAERILPDHDVEPARLLADLVALADDLVARGLAVPVGERGG